MQHFCYFWFLCSNSIFNIFCIHNMRHTRHHRPLKFKKEFSSRHSFQEFFLSLVFCYISVCMQVSIVSISFFVIFSIFSVMNFAKYCVKWSDFSKLLKKKYFCPEKYCFSEVFLQIFLTLIHKSSGSQPISSNKTNVIEKHIIKWLIKQAKNPSIPLLSYA